MPSAIRQLALPVIVQLLKFLPSNSVTHAPAV
jgi:hypothetical protein